MLADFHARETFCSVDFSLHKTCILIFLLIVKLDLYHGELVCMLVLIFAEPICVLISVLKLVACWYFSLRETCKLKFFLRLETDILFMELYSRADFCTLKLFKSLIFLFLYIDFSPAYRLICNPGTCCVWIFLLVELILYHWACFELIVKLVQLIFSLPWNSYCSWNFVRADDLFV